MLMLCVRICSYGLSPPLCDLNSFWEHHIFWTPSPSTPKKNSDAQTSSLLKHLLLYICLLKSQCSSPSNRHYRLLDLIIATILFAGFLQKDFHCFPVGKFSSKWHLPMVKSYGANQQIWSTHHLRVLPSKWPWTSIPRLNENDTLSLKSTSPTSFGLNLINLQAFLWGSSYCYCVCLTPSSLHAINLPWPSFQDSLTSWHCRRSPSSSIQGRTCAGFGCCSRS